MNSKGPATILKTAQESGRLVCARLRGSAVAAGAALVLMIANGCSPPAPVTAPPAHSATNSGGTRTVLAEPWFEESAAAAGLDFRHVSGATGRFWIPEMMSGGVGLLDYDQDGLLDVFCVQAGALGTPGSQTPGHRLYRNRGEGKFQDVTLAAGITGTGYGMGCGCADYDGDGDTDIYVTNVGTNVLYRNEGNGTFTDVTAAAGVGHRGWGTSCAFFDYDLDGHLDLVIANYLNWAPEREVECFSRGGQRDYCSPMNYQAPAMDTLYRNLGNGRFEDVTRAAGLDRAFGNGLGVVCADFSGDGRPDIYVANDAMPNQLWINNGQGQFRDEAMIRGCAVNALGIAEAGMGVATITSATNGLPDLFITHLVGEGNRLFVNRNGFFQDQVTPKGPGAVSMPLTGFGVGFGDLNHDGELDLYVVNGRVKLGQSQHDPRDPYAEPNTLLQGIGAGQFLEVPNAGLKQPALATGRGMAIGDLDNDGDLDLVINNRDGPLRFLRNVSPKKGHWSMFRVLDQNHRDAIGATLQITAGAVTHWRRVAPHEGYCSSNDPRVHCGLGDAARVDRVLVRWASGKTEIFGPFAGDQLQTLEQGKGRP
jgi:hypothetical protein